jgi:hypothetical protein
MGIWHVRGLRFLFPLSQLRFELQDRLANGSPVERFARKIEKVLSLLEVVLIPTAKTECDGRIAKERRYGRRADGVSRAVRPL